MPARWTSSPWRGRGRRRAAITADDVGQVETLLDGVHGSVNRSTGVKRASLDDYPFSLTFERAVIDDEVTSVVLAGGLGIDLDFELVVDYRTLRGLRELRFVIGTEQCSEVTLTSSASGAFDGRVEVARIPLQTQTVYVGPVPVVLTYELFLSLAASGQLEAELVVGAAQTAEARLGASYVKDRSPNEWRGIAEVDAGFEPLVNPALTVDAQARGAVGTPASLLVYGLVGPRVGLDAGRRAPALDHRQRGRPDRLLVSRAADHDIRWSARPTNEPDDERRPDHP